MSSETLGIMWVMSIMSDDCFMLKWLIEYAVGIFRMDEMIVDVNVI